MIAGLQLNKQRPLTRQSALLPLQVQRELLRIFSRLLPRLQLVLKSLDLVLHLQ